MSRTRSPHWRVGWASLLVVGLVLGWWAVNLLQLKASVDADAAYWSQPRGERGGLVYVALGDSAAQGIGASQPDRGYVGVLAGRLRAQTGRPVLVVNLSVSGAKIADVVADQLPELAALPADLQPDVLTVGVGGNDVLSYDPAEFAERSRALVDGLPACAVVADVPYFMHGRPEDDAFAGATVLHDAAVAEGLAVAPLHATMRASGPAAMISDYAADWFHPDDRGHQVWADAFWPALKDRVDEGSADQGCSSPTDRHSS